MLTHLSVRDLAVVDTLSVEFASGLTVLTGETGAGKSILVDALSLALGARASAQLVRTGRERAEVTALFDIAPIAAARALLRRLELDEDETELHLRRTVNTDGRSRAYVNGRPVPQQTLRELGATLVDIHGQHEHQSLLDGAVQRDLLDAYAGNEALLARTRASHSRWQALLEEQRRLGGDGAEQAARRDLLDYQVSELDELAPTASEFETARVELGRLSRADVQRDRARAALGLISDEDGADERLRRALAMSAELAARDASAAGIVELLQSAAIHLDEACDALRDYADAQHGDPQRIAELEARMEALQGVARKHRIEPEGLPEVHQRLREELVALDAGSARLAALVEEVDAAERAYRDAAAALSSARQDAARRFGSAVTEHMHELGIPGGHCEVAVVGGATPRSSGSDRVDILVATNPGSAAQPLRRVASGGELSRVSLAIQVILAGSSGVPTLVFDEVDVGIGGRVAEIVGKRLRAVADHRQVLCVTHLPQVACQGHAHLRVTKAVQAGTPETVLDALGPDERVTEVARMLGGVRITERALAHAREMLELAGR